MFWPTGAPHRMRVDDFQDTDAAQDEAFKSLTREEVLSLRA